MHEFLKFWPYKAAWFIVPKIRTALAERDARYKLAGLIERDDSYFGESQVSGKRGRGADKKAKVVVSVKVNELEKPAFNNMTVVPKVDKENVSKVTQDKIQSGSTLKTDGWSSYNVLKEPDLNHQKEVVDSAENASEFLP